MLINSIQYAIKKLITSINIKVYILKSYNNITNNLLDCNKYSILIAEKL